MVTRSLHRLVIRREQANGIMDRSRVSLFVRRAEEPPVPTIPGFVDRLRIRPRLPRENQTAMKGLVRTTRGAPSGPYILWRANSSQVLAQLVGAAVIYVGAKYLRYHGQVGLLPCSRSPKFWLPIGWPVSNRSRTAPPPWRPLQVVGPIGTPSCLVVI